MSSIRNWFRERLGVSAPAERCLGLARADRRPSKTSSDTGMALGKLMDFGKFVDCKVLVPTTESAIKVWAQAEEERKG